ncbi:CoA pyrophosphatase [Rhodocytophaga rosea]|uniref:CoA pyrophosphatase n=1 Tax=Rhodocytophaga rosea TaxID=2704465 RepID=A0A6C0GTA0_9BACT|nr:CoA pyrophosphatase [Rhodocytophaga rosea]QHT71034.1 CoA pyrophosphatase [Rhodocytophaga rosea]
MHQLFFEKIKERLKQTLPGPAAQVKMASTLRSILRLPAQPNDDTRSSAVLILFYPVENIIHIPLMVRPVYKGVHSGQVSLPGGRREESDQTLIETALREAKEEIGIIPRQIEILGALTELYVPASNFLVLPVVGSIRQRPDFKIDPYEVDRLLEVPLNELQDVTRIGSKEIVVRDTITIQAPYYDLQGYTVWGATAMIMSELNEILTELS